MISGPFIDDLPSGKRLHNYGKSPFYMGKLAISMAMFNSFLMLFVCLPEGIIEPWPASRRTVGVSQSATGCPGHLHSNRHP
jgi:hypothetical protein